MRDDAGAIDEVVRRMFGAFASTNVAGGSLDRLPELFAPCARVVVMVGGELRTTNVADFIAPRRELLLGGELTDFDEWETEGETLVGRDIACRRSRYAKKGKRNGAAFTGGGTKVMTLVRVNGAWKILELLWQDDG